jgi:hypothetical protein
MDTFTPVPTEDRRYSLVCNHYIGRRRVNRVIARGMTWEAVRALESKMQARECASRPRWSSWTGRIYIAELENPSPRPGRSRPPARRSGS